MARFLITLILCLLPLVEAQAAGNSAQVFESLLSPDGVKALIESDLSKSCTCSSPLPDGVFGNWASDDPGGGQKVAISIQKIPGDNNSAKIVYAWWNSRYGSDTLLMSGILRLGGSEVVFQSSGGNTKFFLDTQKGEGMVVYSGARDPVRTRVYKIN